jgi:hypothetical protein
MINIIISFIAGFIIGLAFVGILFGRKIAQAIDVLAKYHENQEE